MHLQAPFHQYQAPFATDLELWKKMFLYHSSSPAYDTNTLTVCRPGAVTVANAEEGGWIRTFSRVVQLGLRISPDSGESQAEGFPAPFYEFSPTLKCEFYLSSPPRFTDF